MQVERHPSPAVSYTHLDVYKRQLLLTGNEMGVLLLDYICKTRAARDRPVAFVFKTLADPQQGRIRFIKRCVQETARALYPPPVTPPESSAPEAAGRTREGRRRRRCGG